MDFEKKENSADVTPDSPIDLSQLSTRCRNVDLTNRSVSESCLAPTAAVAAKKRRIHGFKDPLPPAPAPLMSEHSAADSLKYRSMSHADIAGYRTPWLSAEVTESSSTTSRIPAAKTSAQTVEIPTAAAAAAATTLSAAETLKFRCMSESRLAGPGHTAFHPAATAIFGNSASAGGRSRNLGATSNSDLLRAATDNSQLEFLLRRTHSESVLPTSRSGEMAGSAAIEFILRQQLMLQHLFPHQQSTQDGSDPGSGSSSSSSSASYLPSATNWLFNLYGYGCLPFLSASQQQQIATDPATGSGQISGGPSSPAVGAVSVSGSDGEGEMEEEDMETGEFSHGKKRSPRALTGKHVKLGTGASPVVLSKLRLKVQESQRMKLVKKSMPSGSAFASAAAAKKNGSKLKSRAK